MHTYTANISWTRKDASFTDQRYSRAHTWRFDGGAEVAASSSPLIVPLPWSEAGAVDPEEALVAAASSCHMLCFLSLAARAGFLVDSYTDAASATMTKNAEGRLAITRIELRPRLVCTGRQPSAAELESLHHAAHDECYIAHSIRAEVAVIPA